MNVVFMALVLLAVVCAGALGGAVFLMPRRKTSRMRLIALEGLFEEVAEAALMVDAALEPRPRAAGSAGATAAEPKRVWFTKLFHAQLAVRDEVSKLAVTNRFTANVVWWVRIEQDLSRALARQAVEPVRRGPAPDDQAWVDELKVLLDAVVTWNEELASNLRLVRTVGLDEEAVTALRDGADEKMKAVYENNGWPLIPTEAGLRWPGEAGRGFG